ncbi:MAG: Mth938-like domain-containing protein [Beijerinckiaceae bacterium]|nr:Mth938-like domain-containing protein [Beijerinckiaceae bacterium]MCI0737386.1 Mth938-like domain-containing protein [Beijerinckiaceae bacterium]
MVEPRYAGFLLGAHAIEGYGAGGFRFGAISHGGSILALPSGIVTWSAQPVAGIDIASLEALFREPPGSVDYLLAGSGADAAPLDVSLRQRLAEAGIKPEPMSTGAAARTYSILLGESRRVAAALLAVP